LGPEPVVAQDVIGFNGHLLYRLHLLFLLEVLIKALIHCLHNLKVLYIIFPVSVIVIGVHSLKLRSLHLRLSSLLVQVILVCQHMRLEPDNLLSLAQVRRMLH
jgi:hypothetical protein